MSRLPYVCVFVVGGLTVSDVRMTVKSIAAMRREREQPENKRERRFLWGNMPEKT